MKSLTTKEIVKKLIGNIRPSGEYAIDEERFENLKEMCMLVSELIEDIDSVNLDFYQSEAHSESKASEYALKFLTKELGIV